MGLISDLAKSNSPFRDLSDPAGLWRRAFGSTDKERTFRSREPSQPRRSVITEEPQRVLRTLAGNDAAIARLLEAHRSPAPGGWSADRWEQTRHFVGITYVAVHRICTQLAQAEFQVWKKDPQHPDGKRAVTPDDPPEGEKNKALDVRPYDLVRLLSRPNWRSSFGKMMYCFPPGTRVRMGDGSHKNIEQINLLDEVLTAEGNVHKVRQLHSRKYDGELVNVKLWGHSHLKLTPNHEVLTQRGYVPAEGITKDDWVVIPKYVPVQSKVLQTAGHVTAEVGSKIKTTHGGAEATWRNYKRVPDFIELNARSGRIFGLYIAEGHTEKNGTVVWSFGTHESGTLVAELIDLLRDEWGLEAYTQTRNAKGSVTQVVVCGKLWARLFRSLCGKGASTKKIHPDLLSGPDDFLEAVFRGWADGDGYVHRGHLCGATVSHDLALNMFDIANHLGWRPSIRRDAPQNALFDGVRLKQKPVWRVTLGADTDSYRVKNEAGRMWRRVKETTREPYTGDVFNIGVETDNSYVAESVGVHNCWGQQRRLTGTALTWMVPNLAGVPMELYSVPTAVAVPQAVNNDEYPRGYYRIQPLYPYGPFSTNPSQGNTTVGAPIPAQWMLRFDYPHPFLHYEGYSPLTGLSHHIDEVEMMDRSRHYKMRRSINPSAVLQFDNMDEAQPLPEEEIERIRAQLEAALQGPENHGNLYIAAPGSRLEEFGSKIIEMDYVNGWGQLTDFVLGGGFGITKPAAGMMESVSYSTLFATLKQLNLLTLDPECDDIASELTHHLAPFFGSDLVVEIRCKRIDDHDVKNAKLGVLITAKATTKNEVRKELGFPLTTEQWGTEIAGEMPQPAGPGGPGMPPPAQGAPGGDAGAALAAAAAQGPGSPALASPDLQGGAPQGALGPDAEGAAVELARPRPSPLGVGSLGPRKHLNGRLHKALNGTRKKGEVPPSPFRKAKSFYEEVREALSVNE